MLEVEPGRLGVGGECNTFYACMKFLKDKRIKYIFIKERKWMELEKFSFIWKHTQRS